MRIRTLIREYFTFSRNERIGLIVLMALILVLGVANKVIFYFETPGEADQQAFQQMIAEFESSSSDEDQIELKSKKLFPFDPNQIDSLGLDSLDLPDQVKRNMLKYRSGGGRFYRISDFRKIYGMNDSIFSTVDSFIVLKSTQKAAVRSPRKTVELDKTEFTAVKKPEVVERRIVEINAASESDFKSLHGIGEVLSGRIVKYRNLLGGFYNVHQLTEVYGLPEETFESIQPFLNVDTMLITKIDINFSDKKELARHPYLDWKDAQAILDFRSKNGYINHLSGLVDNKVLNDTVYSKIRPYLKTKN